MDYGVSDPAGGHPQSPGQHRAIKILLAGGFGVGKTTLVGAVSEIRPLRTEEPLTEGSLRTDNSGRRQIPFIVAINCFDGARRYDTEDVRMALDLEPDMPIVLCDARSKESAKDVLIALVEHVLVTASEEPLSGIA